MISPQSCHPADWSGRFAAVVAPAILILTLGWLAVASFKASSRHQVFLVNGLPEGYSVEVAGETHFLPPGRATSIELAQRRDHVVTVTPEGPSIEPVEVRLEVPFGESFGGSRTFVVNPDRAALLFWQQAEYSEHPEPLRNLLRALSGGAPSPLSPRSTAVVGGNTGAWRGS